MRDEATAKAPVEASSRSSDAPPARPTPPPVEWGAERVIGEELDLVFDLSPIGMAISSLQGHFLEVNPALCKTLGYTREDLRKRRHADITHPDDLRRKTDLTERLLRGEVPHYELQQRYVAVNGRIVQALVKVGLLRDGDGEPLHILSQIIDISERVAMEERLRFAAEHDSLTGLPNRNAFMQLLSQLREEQARFGVIFLDLDQFKIVNDSLGHQAGDDLLVAIARRLRETLPERHLLSRHGGDEFTVLLPDVSDTKAAVEVAQLMQAALTLPFELHGQDIFVSASIGIALATSEHASSEEILRNADTAMYRAKSKGRGRQVVFDDTMHAKVVRRLKLETDLRRAVKNQHFETFYQPIVTLSSPERIVGFEALLRWRHEELGLLKPSAYLEVAEDTGQIIPIGNWLLREACEALSRWRRDRPETTPEFMSVNVSNRQFAHPEFPIHVERALADSGLPAECLRLELTETVIMDYGLETQILLAHLRDLGCRVYVDDFGTGYSSLAHLHRLPIDALKIDRGFVQGSVPRGDGLEIVRAIVSLAKNLDLEVIAEGIETEEQLEQLRILGCKLGQGFLFAEPVDLETATQLVISGLADRSKS